jgi:hypothetical protein
MSTVYIIAAPAASNAGIITSVASVFTGVILLITAVIGLYQVTRLKKQGKDTADKVDVVHDLVNHLYTDALRSDLEATQTSYVTMVELVALRMKDGTSPSAQTLAAQEAANAKIVRLTAELAERQTVVDAIIERHGTEATK